MKLTVRSWRPDTGEKSEVVYMKKAEAYAAAERFRKSIPNGIEGAGAYVLILAKSGVLIPKIVDGWRKDPSGPWAKQFWL